MEYNRTHTAVLDSTENLDSQNGPDQILPATEYSTTAPDGRVKLRDTENDSAYKPISIPGLLRTTAKQYPNAPAIAFKEEDDEWKFLTYKEYEETVRTCAKGFLKLGLERYHSVCLLGHNTPECFFTILGAIYAGGFSAGIYTTNSAEACHYSAEKCRANIIVVENQEQLEKILKIKSRLTYLKSIVQYHGTPEVEGVISWKELMKIGQEETDTKLNEVLKTISINECCSILYTSGTTSNPKAVMLSHDNITWNAVKIRDHVKMKMAEEVLVSYLPLSHIAAQIVDIYISMCSAATVYFADKDALKGSLLKTLLEARPTLFLGVPRVWEKMYEKMQEASSKSSLFRKYILSWAKYQGLQHYTNKMNGNESGSISYYVAKNLIFSQIKKAIGLERCRLCASASAPISVDIKRFYMSIDIILIEAYGLTECSGAHILGSPTDIILEGIGKTQPGYETKIDSPNADKQGEICLNGRHIFMGYMNDPQKTEEVLDDDGWFHTGDIGKTDENGFLYVTGRIKEIIITAGGENIAPILIEDEVKAQLPCISNAMLIGDRRKYLIILLTLKTEINIQTGEPLEELMPDTKKWCKEIGCEANTVKDILEGPNKKFMDAIQEGIDRVNTKAISRAQRVQKFAVLPHDFSIHTGELGPTMKLKRSYTEKMYEDIIETLYQ